MRRRCRPGPGPTWYASRSASRTSRTSSAIWTKRWRRPDARSILLLQGLRHVVAHAREGVRLQPDLHDLGIDAGGVALESFPRLVPHLLLGEPERVRRQPGQALRAHDRVLENVAVGDRVDQAEFERHV